MVSFVAVLALIGATYGVATSRTRTGAASSPVTVSAQHVSCPKDILGDESRFAPIAEVLRAAQRLLAQETINSQGTIYHLTPRHAPIDYIQQLDVYGAPVDDQVPGRVALYRAAASACGEATAHASWAIRYTVPVSLIAGTAGYPFFVKTRTGWRFWGGGWCGVGHSREWRARYCR